MPQASSKPAALALIAGLLAVPATAFFFVNAVDLGERRELEATVTGLPGDAAGQVVTQFISAGDENSGCAGTVLASVTVYVDDFPPQVEEHDLTRDAGCVKTIVTAGSVTAAVEERLDPPVPLSALGSILETTAPNLVTLSFHPAVTEEAGDTAYAETVGGENALLCDGTPTTMAIGIPLPTHPLPPTDPEAIQCVRVTLRPDEETQYAVDVSLVPAREAAAGAQGAIVETAPAEANVGFHETAPENSEVLLLPGFGGGENPSRFTCSDPLPDAALHVPITSGTPSPPALQTAAGNAAANHEAVNCVSLHVPGFAQATISLAPAREAAGTVAGASPDVAVKTEFYEGACSGEAADGRIHVNLHQGTREIESPLAATTMSCLRLSLTRPSGATTLEFADLPTGQTPPEAPAFAFDGPWYEVESCADNPHAVCRYKLGMTVTHDGQTYGAIEESDERIEETPRTLEEPLPSGDPPTLIPAGAPTHLSIPMALYTIGPNYATTSEVDPLLVPLLGLPIGSPNVEHAVAWQDFNGASIPKSITVTVGDVTQSVDVPVSPGALDALPGELQGPVNDVLALLDAAGLLAAAEAAAGATGEDADIPLTDPLPLPEEVDAVLAALPDAQALLASADPAGDAEATALSALGLVLSALNEQGADDAINEENAEAVVQCAFAMAANAPSPSPPDAAGLKTAAGSGDAHAIAGALTGLLMTPGTGLPLDCFDAMGVAEGVQRALLPDDRDNEVSAAALFALVHEHTGSDPDREVQPATGYSVAGVIDHPDSEARLYAYCTQLSLRATLAGQNDPITGNEMDDLPTAENPDGTLPAETWGTLQDLELQTRVRDAFLAVYEAYVTGRSTADGSAPEEADCPFGNDTETGVSVGDSLGNAWQNPGPSANAWISGRGDVTLCAWGDPGMGNPNWEWTLHVKEDAASGHPETADFTRAMAARDDGCMAATLGSPDWSGSSDGTASAFWITGKGVAAEVRIPAEGHHGLRLDLAKPAASIQATPPAAGNARIDLAWQGEDGDGSGVAAYQVQYKREGGSWTKLLDRTGLSSAHFTAPRDGTYVFCAAAMDAVGHWGQCHASAEVAVTGLDPDPAVTPIDLALEAPLGSSLHGSVDARVSATPGDPLVTVRACAYPSLKPVAKLYEGYLGKFTWRTESLPDGKYVLCMEAKDGARTGSGLSRVLTIDNLAPPVKVTCADDVDGKLQLCVNAGDAIRVCAFIDGQCQRFAKSGGEWVLATGLNAAVPYTFRIEAEDAAGNKVTRLHAHAPAAKIGGQDGTNVGGASGDGTSAGTGGGATGTGSGTETKPDRRTPSRDRLDAEQKSTPGFGGILGGLGALAAVALLGRSGSQDP